jgi:hypothetical protein
VEASSNATFAPLDPTFARSENLVAFKIFTELVVAGDRTPGDEVFVGSKTPPERALSTLLVSSAKLQRLGCL